jgi:Glycosyltransferases involved in cell wall biogenesis
MVTEVIVCNNNSTDATPIQAAAAGATVVTQNRPGYGNACLKGMEYIAHNNLKTDIIVFLDGDYSDYPEQLTQLVAPIIHQDFDLVIGARVSALREKGP